MKVGIIGTGWVGTSVAISVVHAGLARELLLNDVNEELAEGEAMDLRHGSPFYGATAVSRSSVEEMNDADAVVIAAGRGGGPGETRLDLLRDNAAIATKIAKKLTAMHGTIVVVSNPVDVLTHLVTEVSGLPPSRVIGTGTMLDTARLRQVLGRELDLSPRSVHANVVGEHGDSEVALWSSATAGGRALRDWPGWRREDEPRLAEEVRRAAHEIIARKGATNHAIGLVTADLLRGILRGERRILTVSQLQQAGSGFEGVALSLPTIVGREGALRVLAPELDDEERAALSRSADVLRAAHAEIRPG